MKILSVLFTLFLSIGLYAQEGSKRLTLAVAPAFPLGDWASKNESIDHSGYASSGQSFTLRYSNDFSKNWGWQLLIKGQRNQLNAEKLEDYYSKQSLWGTQVNNWSFKKKNWMTATAMGGIYRIIPAGKRSLFLPELGLGLIYAKLPDFLGTANEQNKMAALTRKGKHGLGLAYTLGLSARHQLNEKWDLFSSLAYFGSSKVKFSDVSTAQFYTDGVSAFQSTQTRDHRQVFSSVNLYIGASMRL
ncbi:hypothetical protein [Flavihumibacter sp. UBA7668]|uniref:hypothetical protein n=1 Tax=Flavihumibacter sp. UBA7668 TaxID=1946542 RepID=UPI0025BCABCF|nr:hypothetical protein [Flavihumibacter sp. UBA7668]